MQTRDKWMEYVPTSFFCLHDSEKTLPVGQCDVEIPNLKAFHQISSPTFRRGKGANVLNQ